MMTLFIPSYGQGFASSAAESENPGLWRGLAGLWLPFLGPTGNTLRDVSGRANHMMLTNMTPATDWETFEGGYNLDFDGVNDYALGSDVNLGTVHSGWCWRRDLDSGSRVLVSGNTAANYFISVQAFKWYYSANEGTPKNYSFSFTPSGWQHLVVTRNNTALTFYADGVVVNQGSFDALNPALSIGRIGAYFDGTLPTQGDVAGVGLWNRVLRASEVCDIKADPYAIVRPRRRVYAAAAVPPAGLSIPIAEYHYQHNLSG